MEQIKVTDETTERLDNYILKHYPDIGLGRLNKYFRENKIKVNGKKLPLSYKVNKNDNINLFLPYSTDIIKEKRSITSTDFIYEDDNIIICNKPAGLPVEAHSGNDSLLERLKSFFAAKGNIEPLLCHRLDTGTSGLILIAKNADAFEEISALIKLRKIKKEYVCVTFGRPVPEKAVKKAWLTKNSESGMVFVTEKLEKGAKEIITEYKTLAVSGPLALLKINLITGRTHQIRAHMSFLGCPVLGDSKYGNNQANRKYKLKYQALCAYQITFPEIDNSSMLRALSQKCFTAEKPWYYEQMLSGALK